MVFRKWSSTLLVKIIRLLSSGRDGETRKYELPFPPTVNNYWTRTRYGMKRTAKAKKYCRDVVAILENEKPLPDGARLAVCITLHAPDKRKRDVDNYPKGILDAITRAESVYRDDSQIDYLTILRGPLAKRGYVEVAITLLDF